MLTTSHHKLQANAEQMHCSVHQDAHGIPSSCTCCSSLSICMYLAQHELENVKYVSIICCYCQPVACSISLHPARVTSLAGGEWPPGHGPGSHPQGIHWECPASRSACCVCFHAALLQNPHNKAYHCCLVMLDDVHFALGSMLSLAVCHEDAPSYTARY